MLQKCISFQVREIFPSKAKPSARFSLCKWESYNCGTLNINCSRITVEATEYPAYAFSLIMANFECFTEKRTFLPGKKKKKVYQDMKIFLPCFQRWLSEVQGTRLMQSICSGNRQHSVLFQPPWHIGYLIIHITNLISFFPRILFVSFKIIPSYHHLTLKFLLHCPIQKLEVCFLDG